MKAHIEERERLLNVIKKLIGVLDEIVNVRDIPRDPFEDVSVFDESTYRRKVAQEAIDSFRQL